MSVTLHCWGNSIGPRLPKMLLDQLDLRAGSAVDAGWRESVLGVILDIRR